jgi:putative DNA primase/helicase
MMADRPESLPVDEAQIEQFVNALLCYGEDGTYVSLRTFPQSKSSTPPIIHGILIDDRAALIRAAIEAATAAANRPEPAVFSSPLATFRTRFKADFNDLANGLTLSVDLDEGDIKSKRASLEQVLGPPTLAVTSGTDWIDPVSREAVPKAHLHWRLSEATRSELEHKELKRARRLAATLLSSDLSAANPVHPLRWPGSWNRKLKSTQRLANITDHNPRIEIHLQDATERLESEVRRSGLLVARPKHGQSPANPTASISRVRSALGTLSNAGDWNEWNRIAMAVWRASNGSSAGLLAWIKWSAKSPRHDEQTCCDRWDGITKSPPKEIGAGTIFHLAQLQGWADDHRAAYWPEYRDKIESDLTLRPWNSGSERVSHCAALPRAAMTANLAMFEPTEDGLAQAFVSRKRQMLQYDHDAGAWFRWDDNIWKKDCMGETSSDIRDLCRDYAQLKCLETRDKVRVCSKKTVECVEKFAQADETFRTSAASWDADPLLLGTLRGTVDLRNGRVRSSEARDYMTQQTSVAPDSVAHCPKWLKFLEEATAGDNTLIQFLQMWCGYMLTGNTQEQAFVFIHGTGGGGKGTFLNTVQKIFGSYAKVAAEDTFTETKFTQHPTDLAMLHRARAVIVNETPATGAWSERRLKSVTGGDEVTARFLNRNFFSYQPKFKITITGNDQPTLRSADFAMRRRMILVPFAVKCTNPNPKLRAELMDEAPSILRWMIEGALKWQKEGLCRSTVAETATDEYFANEDILQGWMNECCEVRDGVHATSESLFKSWQAYCDIQNEYCHSTTWLVKKLVGKGFVSLPDTPGFRKKRGVKGLRISKEPGHDTIL